MSIADDLRAAADKLHEARAGGDEVAIQCVEALRRHAETIERVEKEMRERKINNGRNTSPTLIAWADALKGETT